MRDGLHINVFDLIVASSLCWFFCSLFLFRLTRLREKNRLKFFQWLYLVGYYILLIPSVPMCVFSALTTGWMSESKDNTLSKLFSPTRPWSRFDPTDDEYYALERHKSVIAGLKLVSCILVVLLLLVTFLVVQFVSDRPISISTSAPSVFMTSDAGYDEDDTVYVTENGSRFHRKNCPTISDSHVTALSRDDAIANDYEPCKKCDP